MDDLRPRATASIDVDLSTLAKEMGENRLSLDEDHRTVVVALEAGVTQQALELALANHSPLPPPPLPEARLEQLLAALENAGSLADIRQAAAEARADTTEGT